MKLGAYLTLLNLDNSKAPCSAWSGKLPPSPYGVIIFSKVRPEWHRTVTPPLSLSLSLFIIFESLCWNWSDIVSIHSQPTISVSCCPFTVCWVIPDSSWSLSCASCEMLQMLISFNICDPDASPLCIIRDVHC